MFQHNGKLIYHKEISPNHMLMVIDAIEIAKNAVMGQFVEVRVSDSYKGQSAFMILIKNWVLSVFCIK
jgi:NAD(P)H-flavin reductase